MKIDFNKEKNENMFFFFFQESQHSIKKYNRKITGIIEEYQTLVFFK